MREQKQWLSSATVQNLAFADLWKKGYTNPLQRATVNRLQMHRFISHPNWGFAFNSIRTWMSCSPLQLLRFKWRLKLINSESAPSLSPCGFTAQNPKACIRSSKKKPKSFSERKSLQCSLQAPCDRICVPATKTNSSASKPPLPWQSFPHRSSPILSWGCPASSLTSSTTSWIATATGPLI